MATNYYNHGLEPKREETTDHVEGLLTEQGVNPDNYHTFSVGGKVYVARVDREEGDIVDSEVWRGNSYRRDEIYIVDPGQGNGEEPELRKAKEIEIQPLLQE